MTTPLRSIHVRRAVQRLRCQRWLREYRAFLASGRALRGDRLVLAGIAAQMREAVRIDEEAP